MSDPIPTEPAKEPNYNLNTKDRRHNGGKVLLAFAVLFLMGATLSMGYLYYSEYQKANDAKSTIESKDKEISRLKAVAPVAEQKATYKSDVGKFTLSLPSDFYIVRNYDGTYEGGPAVQLFVGKALDGQYNAIDIDMPKQLSLSSWPKSSYQADLNSFLQSRLGDLDSNNIGPVTIDGQSASQYVTEDLLGGLVRKLIFEHGDNYYDISVAGVNASGNDSNGYLQSVIDGFKFAQ